MNKKIGIVTIYGNDNYGNRLQNYALETSIRKLGFSVETIVIDEPGEKIKLFRRSVKKLLSSKENRNKYIARKKMIKKKEKIFAEFTDNYLNNVRYKYNDDFSNFQKVFVGSDQVWNPNFDLKKIHFLRFVEKNKRYSYAASIATDEIPLNKKEKFSEYLNGMMNISVREKSSVEVVKKLIGKNATCVLDPTMLLKKEDYINLIESSKSNVEQKRKEYILIYCLSDLKPDLKKEIQNYSESNNLEIVQIMGNYYNESHVIYDPIGFIDAINNAKLVITDSFHSGVFSIIMETPFFSYRSYGWS